jgi:hypothetical protein
MVCAFRFDARGVRVVTNVERNAVDALALTDEQRWVRTAKSCGPGTPRQVPNWRQCVPHCADDGGKRWFTGEHGVSRKPLRREGRSVSACTCGSRALAQIPFARGPPGACGHPVFPAPSLYLGATNHAKLGRKWRRENVGECRGPRIPRYDCRMKRPASVVVQKFSSFCESSKITSESKPH